MAFPTLLYSRVTNGSTASATPVLNIPNSSTGTASAAGDLIVVLVRVALAGAIGWPDASWVELFDASDDAADDQMALAWHTVTSGDAAADPGSISITCTSAKFAALAWLIRDAAVPTTQPPQLSTVATGVSPNEPNATTCTPIGGAKDYLWITFWGMEGEQTGITTRPTNYVDPPPGGGVGAFANSGTGGAVATNCTLGCAYRTNNAASDDAGVWDVAGTLDDWTAYTMAVHPAAAVDPTTLGYRPVLPVFALNGQQNPVEPGGMTPGCHQLPDVLTG